MSDSTKNAKDREKGEKDRESAWAKVQKLIDQANDAVVAWQKKFITPGARIADSHEIPDTPAHRRGQEKRQRHADAVAAGEMNYKDIALERQADFAERFASMPDGDRALLNDWAARQEAAHGSPLGVWEHHAMAWPLVFLAARYGAEVEHWPAKLSKDDKDRIASLDRRGATSLALVEPLHVAAANKHAGRRVHLFTSASGKKHLDRALARAAQPSTPIASQE